MFLEGHEEDTGNAGPDVHTVHVYVQTANKDPAVENWQELNLLHKCILHFLHNANKESDLLDSFHEINQSRFLLSFAFKNCSLIEKCKFT